MGNTDLLAGAFASRKLRGDFLRGSFHHVRRWTLLAHRDQLKVREIFVHPDCRLKIVSVGHYLQVRLRADSANHYEIFSARLEMVQNFLVAPRSRLVTRRFVLRDI